MNNNKITYILLGLGIGIIITNILYYINPRIEYEQISDEDIINRAEDLGMRTIKESIIINEKAKEIKDENIDEQIEKKENKKESKSMVFEIVKGDDLYTISEKLHKFGLIDNQKKFEDRVYERELSKKMHYGTYEIDYNSDYDLIIDILVKK